MGRFSNALKPLVVFVLGGPGAGKTVQSKLAVAALRNSDNKSCNIAAPARPSSPIRLCHLSAGALLRAFVEGDSESLPITKGENKGYLMRMREVCKRMISKGRVVPSEVRKNLDLVVEFNLQIVLRVTVTLLSETMKLESVSSNWNGFIIDGFPRNDQNRMKFVSQNGGDCDLCVYLDCPSSVLTARLLTRNEGRNDDNLDVIERRIEVFRKSTMPVIEYYGGKGLLSTVDGNRSSWDVNTDIVNIIRTRIYLEEHGTAAD